MIFTKFFSIDFIQLFYVRRMGVDILSMTIFDESICPGNQYFLEKLLTRALH